MAIHPGRVAPGRPCQGNTPGACAADDATWCTETTDATAVSRTLSKSAPLGPAQVSMARDLDCLS